MLKKLRSLFKNTLIYGLTTVTARGVNYVLVPIYANTLTVSDNGVQGLIYANVAFLVVIYMYGMDVAYMKFASVNDKGKKIAFSTAVLSLTLSSCLLSLGLFFFAETACSLININTDHTLLIRWMAIVLALDTIVQIPLAKLRLEQKATAYGLVKLFNVFVNVMVSLTLVLYLDMGLLGVVLGNVMSSLATFLLMLPVLFTVRFTFDASLWQDLLKYGAPLIPNGIALIAIDFIDRNVLAQLSSDEITAIYGTSTMSSSQIVGIYSRVCAFGMAVNIFVQVFRTAWIPFALSHQNDHDASRLFSKVLTLSFSTISLISLSASLFLPFLIKYKFFDSFYLLPPAYWMGLSILPIICLSYMLNILVVNFTAGILIKKKTAILPVMTVIGAVVAFLLSITLIPWFGMMGAAVSGVTGFVAMVVGISVVSVRTYPNKYEWSKIFMIFFSACFIYLGSRYLKDEIIVNCLLFALFAFILALLSRRDIMFLLQRVKQSRK